MNGNGFPCQRDQPAGIAGPHRTRLFERQFRRHIALQGIGKGLVRHDVGHDAATGQLRQHGGGIRAQRQRQRTPRVASGLPLRDRVVEIVGGGIAIAAGDAAIDARLVDLDHQRRRAGELSGQRLSAAHAAAARRQQQTPGQRAAEMLARDRHEGFEGPLQNALAADVLPGGGGHSGIDGEAHIVELAAVVLAAPFADYIAVGHDDERRRRLAGKHADRLARLHDEGLILAHGRQRRDNAVEAVPVARRARDRHVDDEIFRVLAIFEVVLQQPKNRFLAPASAAQDGAAFSPDLFAAAYRNSHAQPSSTRGTQPGCALTRASHAPIDGNLAIS